MFEVRFYESDDGHKPALEQICRIKDQKLKAKVFRSLKLLESFGNQLGWPDSAPLRDGIFELRTVHSSNIVRTLYFFQKERTVVVTNSFIKKTQKTPEKEIETAIKRRKDYEKKTKRTGYDH